MLNYTDVMNTLKHLVRVPELFSMTRDVLTNDCFHIPEGGYFEKTSEMMELPLLYIWRGLKLYYDGQQAVVAPTYEQLEHYVREVLRSGVYRTDELDARLFASDPTIGYLAYIYAVEHTALNASTGTPLIKAFLKERLVTDRTGGLLTFAHRDNRQFDDNFKQLSENLARVNALGVTYAPTSLVPTQEYVGRIRDEQTLKTTGIGFLDAGLGGGQRPGEVNAIIGCSGAGKTMFGVQIACESYRQSILEADSQGVQPMTVYYTYEQSADDLRSRFISNGASIARSEIALRSDTYRGVINPSTDESNVKEYEKELWDSPDCREYEMERIEAFSRLSERSLILRNFSGVSDLNDSPEEALRKQSVGIDGVNSVANDLKYLTTLYGAPVRTVILDYTGPMLKRMSCVKNDDDYRFHLAGLADKLRYQVAGPYKCTVWVLHQVTAARNGGSPGKRLTIADSSDCKSFTYNVANAILLGKPDAGHHPNGGGPCLYMTMDKHRHAEGEEIHSGIIVQHDKYFARLNDVRDQFYWSDSGSRNGLKNFKYKKRC